MDQVLQEVPVVAGDFDNEMMSREAELVDHLVDVAPAVIQPAIGVGREVRVVAEDFLTAHILLQLHEETLVADVDDERVKRLHRVQLITTQVTLAQRRHAEVGHDVREGGAAGPARVVSGSRRFPAG